MKERKVFSVFYEKDELSDAFCPLLLLMSYYAFSILKIREYQFFYSYFSYNKKKIHEIKYYSTFSQIANKLLATGHSSHLFTQTYWFSYKEILVGHIILPHKHTVG